jgi:hypothetical protein
LVLDGLERSFSGEEVVVGGKQGLDLLFGFTDSLLVSLLFLLFLLTLCKKIK